MRLVVQRKLRSTLFLCLAAVWLAAVGLVALPRLLFEQLPRNLANAKLAIASDATPLVIASIGMSADMVRMVEQDDSGSTMLAIYGPAQQEALTQQVFRCRQFFYPRTVVALRTAVDIQQLVDTDAAVFVFDYSASNEHSFAEDFALVSELGVLRMWSRGVEK